MNELKDYLGTEAIKYQYKSKLLHGLASLIDEAKGAIEADDSVDLDDVRARISTFIFEETGVLADVEIEPAFYADAWVIVADVDNNNPILTDYQRNYFKKNAIKKLLKKNKSVLSGTVDRASGRVSGVFSKVKNKIYIAVNPITTDGNTVANMDEQFNNYESAATLIHEIGHVVSYFETLGTTFTTNYVLRNLSESMQDADNYVLKQVLIESAGKELGITIEDSLSLAKETNNEVITGVLLKNTIDAKRSELGDSGYDNTAFEFLADQFANRHGAGEYLASAILKYHKFYGDIQTSKTATYILVRVLEVYTVLVFSLMLVLPILFIFFSREMSGVDAIYDDMHNRLKRIRRDTIQVIKTTKDPKELKRLIESIDSVTKSLGETKERTHLIQHLSLLFSASARASKKQINLQRELEAISLNDLHITKAKLSII